MQALVVRDVRMLWAMSIAFELAEVLPSGSASEQPVSLASGERAAGGDDFDSPRAPSLRDCLRVRIDRKRPLRPYGLAVS